MLTVHCKDDTSYEMLEIFSSLEDTTLLKPYVCFALLGILHINLSQHGNEHLWVLF